ncbi:MAG: hypothetical protein ACRDUY_11600 [Nitriliruptorales bacterium]
MPRNGCHEQVVLGRAPEVISDLPERLAVGDIVIELDDAVTTVPWVGRLASRRRTGTWTSGRYRGRLTVDVIPANGELSLLSVMLEPPTGWRRRLIETADMDAAAVAVTAGLCDAVERGVTAGGVGSLVEARANDAIVEQLRALGA